jgi:hypothetical protein
MRPILVTLPYFVRGSFILFKYSAELHILLILEFRKFMEIADAYMDAIYFVSVVTDDPSQYILTFLNLIFFAFTTKPYIVSFFKTKM